MSRGRECLPRLFLVATIERQQAFAPQAVDFWQIKADAEFVDCCRPPGPLGSRVPSDAKIIFSGC